MTAIDLPYSDAVLRLSLPFPGLNHQVRLGLTIVAVVLSVVAIALLYRYEMRLIARRFARTLLLLRLAAFTVLFMALAFEPTLAHARKENVPGKVVIAVDRSESMKVTDPGRPLKEKLLLAKLLKLVPDLASDNQLDSWVNDTVTYGGPRFAAFGSEGERNRFNETIKRLDGTNRLQIVSRILTNDGLKLVERFREKHQLELVGFGRDLVALPVANDRLTAALMPNPREGPTLFTDLKLPLTKASELAGDGSEEGDGPKLLGVVLLTDGRHNWGDSPLNRARELGSRNVPIFPIEVAPLQAPPDIAVITAKAQASTVFKGSVVPIEVGVRISGWPAGKLSVKLEYPAPLEGAAKKPLMQVIDHDGKDAVYPLTFKVKMDESGPQLLSVTADAGPDDRFPDNNTRTARVNVVKDRAKVMLIDGESRWEFHYLHTCLGRDPNMDVRSIVFRQPRITKTPEEELRKVGYSARKLPDDLEVLSSYDCIIIGDVESSQITLAEREALEKYVAESGGTLVMIAGKRAMPAEYAAMESDPFRKLLPIRNPQVFDSPEGFPLNITGEGERSWFLNMGDTPGQNRAAWDRFPQHYWATIGELKDGAEALAALPGGQPSQRAVIARHSFGFGRVMYVGIDSTWRWRFKTGDYFHHRFWGQTAQWAASDRLLPVTNAAGTIRFGTREPIYTGGQDVEVVVRTAESVKKLTPNALKSAKVIRRPDGVDGVEKPSGMIPLTHPEGRPRDLVGKQGELAPGKYYVELDVPEWADQLQGPPGPDGRVTKLRCPFEVAAPDHEELVELSSNRPLLEELAAAGKGKVYTIENATELMDVLTAQTATREYFVESPFRKSWWLLGVFLALVGLEWIVRKWAGLP